MRETSTDEQTKRNEKQNTNIQQTISKQASAHAHMRHDNPTLCFVRISLKRFRVWIYVLDCLVVYRFLDYEPVC
jgi:hypothetical protein